MKKRLKKIVSAIKKVGTLNLVLMFVGAFFIWFNWQMILLYRQCDSMNKGDLKNMTGLSFGTIASMGKNEPVNLKQIDRICKALHCKIEDVIEYKED